MATLAPKLSEERIYCPNPLTVLEPVDDPFLSFNDRKAKRSSESNNNNNN
jgi:hypothetical protein